MQFGVCTGPEGVAAVMAAGFEYWEWTVGGLLCPLEDDASFRSALGKARATRLPCPVVNCFIPGDLKITGPTADLAVLERYVNTAMARAQAAGVDTIVFGSGGARRVPDGFPRSQAHAQLVAFGRMVSPLAAQHGVTVVVEPLNREECNILNGVGESAALVREVDHSHFQLLVDGFHWAKDGDSWSDVAGAGALLRHTHVATLPNRMAPGAEECNLSPFFDALRQAGYRRRMLIEGRIPHPAEDLPRALAVMKALG